MKKTGLFFFLILTISVCIVAQDQPGPTEVKAAVMDDYEASDADPHGRLNPKAPSETAQFDFMIGVFDCVDEIRNPADGKWYRSNSVWSSSYFLNGFGIQDRYWSPITVASGTRLFDPQKKKWVVNYFQSLPRLSYGGVWEGMKEGENIIMRQQNGAVESRLTFSNITEGGFEWKSERVEGDEISSGWNISCKRRALNKK